MFDLIKAAPGVSPTSPASGTVNTVSAFGSGVNENAFLIDGTNFTCPCQGVSRAEPGVDVIQEVQVQSIGASVEYGNIQGAVFNVITKQGGDRFQYDASYYAQTSGLTSQPVVRPVSSRQRAVERVRTRAGTATSRRTSAARSCAIGSGSSAGTSTCATTTVSLARTRQFPRTYEQDKVFGKLTWRLTPALQLMQSFHEEFWVNPTPPTLVTPFDATLRLNASVPSMTFGHLTHTLSSNTVWDVRVGHFALHSRGRSEHRRSDDAEPVRSDHRHVQRERAADRRPDLNRVTAKAVLNRYQPGCSAAITS